MLQEPEIFWISARCAPPRKNSAVQTGFDVVYWEYNFLPKGMTWMKVYLSADIEGTCGICDWSETDRSAAFDYTPYQKQMQREVAAACQGALDAGADLVYVKDAHDSARNLDPMELPEQVRIHRGWSGDPLCMMSGLDRDSYDAVFFTGCHAWASCPGSPLSHTMNQRNDYITINGVLASEFLINAYTAGYFHVPVTFLSGDKALCGFARELIPGITTVAVNEGLGGSVCSIHPAAAVREIHARAKESLGCAARCRLTLPEHFETVVRFRQHKQAYSKSFYPGAVLEGSQNLRFASDDWFEILRFYHFVLGA